MSSYAGGCDKVEFLSSSSRPLPSSCFSVLLGIKQNVSFRLNLKEEQLISKYLQAQLVTLKANVRKQIAPLKKKNPEVEQSLP